MEKIIFEDGVNVSDAKVTIDGQEYIVTPGEYESPTPMSAKVMNMLQDNIENAINQGDNSILHNMSHTYTGTTITAPTTAGMGRIEKVYGTADGVGTDVNLFKLEKFTDGTSRRIHNGVTYEIVDETLKVTGTATGESYAYFDITSLASLELNKSYAFISENGTVNSGVNIKLGTATNSYFVSNMQVNKVVKVLNESITNFGVTIANGSSVNFTIRLKIAKSNKVISYSKYGYGTVEVISKSEEQQASNVTYLDKPLYKVDYLDFKTKKVVRNSLEKVFNGTENWAKSNADSTAESTACWLSLNNAGILKCDKFEIVNIEDLSTKIECIVASNTAIEFKILNSKLATADAAGVKAWLASNNVKIVYELTETLEESVDCADKIQQYDEETTVYNTDGAEIEVTLSNNKAIAEITENIAEVEENAKFEIEANKEISTNRYIGGKRVYVRYFEFGSLPNASSKQVLTPIPVAYRVVELKGIAQNSAQATLALPYPTITIATWVGGSTYTLEVKTTTNLSTYNGFIEVYYTK